MSKRKRISVDNIYHMMNRELPVGFEIVDIQSAYKVFEINVGSFEFAYIGYTLEDINHSEIIQEGDTAYLESGTRNLYVHCIRLDVFGAKQQILRELGVIK